MVKYLSMALFIASYGWFGGTAQAQVALNQPVPSPVGSSFVWAAAAVTVIQSTDDDLWYYRIYVGGAYVAANTIDELRLTARYSQTLGTSNVKGFPQYYAGGTSGNVFGYFDVLCSSETGLAFGAGTKRFKLEGWGTPKNGIVSGLPTMPCWMYVGVNGIENEE